MVNYLLKCKLNANKIINIKITSAEQSSSNMDWSYNGTVFKEKLLYVHWSDRNEMYEKLRLL